MVERDYHLRLTWLLRWGAFLCFAGWTWMHYYWEGPYSGLLWQDATFQLADRLGIDWDDFVGSGANDGFVQTWLARLWWPYLAVTVLSLTVRKGSRWQFLGLGFGCLMLSFTAFAKYANAQYQLPMLVEHSGQILMPLVLILAMTLGVSHRATVLTATLGVIGTFVGHGCYACGIWPIPASFQAMTTLILKTDYESTIRFLLIAGVLDFLACVGILIPWLRRPASGYAAFWGMTTALARPVAGMSLSLNYYGADQFVHEAALRAPHFVLPLYLFWVWRTPQGEDTSPND